MAGPGERKVPASAMRTVLFRASWSGTSALRTCGVEEGSVSQAPWEAALRSLWPGLGSPHDTLLLVGSCVPPGEGWGAAVSIRSKAHGGGLVRAQSLEQRPHTAGGHSSAPRACDRTRPPIPVCSHVPGGLWRKPQLLPTPALPPCLCQGRGGRGPAPRSPTPTPSGILGLMSCKMRRLQLTCTDGVHTRLPTLHTPAPWHCLPVPRRIFSRPWALLSLGSTPLTSRLVPGRTGAAHKPCVPTFSTQAPQVARLAGCSLRPHFPLCEEPGEHSPPGWGPEGLYVLATGALP